MSREKKKEARFQSCKTSAQSNQKANWKKVGYQLFSFVLATFKSARRSIHEKQGVTWAKKNPQVTLSIACWLSPSFPSHNFIAAHYVHYGRFHFFPDLVMNSMHFFFFRGNSTKREQEGDVNSGVAPILRSSAVLCDNNRMTLFSALLCWLLIHHLITNVI